LFRACRAKTRSSSMRSFEVGSSTSGTADVTVRGDPCFISCGVMASCKENGPQAIWLIKFWCLMINTTCGPICLLVFIIIVHRMRRELDQGNENATPQKEDIKRCIGVQYSRTKEARRNQRRNPRSGLSASAWWCTGHWCPVCTGLSGVAPDSLRREATDKRSLAVAPDCPVCTGLSGVPTGRRQRSDPTVDCYRRQRSADVACTGHLLCSVRWCTGMSGGAPECPVHPTTESCCFLSNG
jgi:hypothetical protein